MSIEQQIEQALRSALQPSSLSVENESHMHSVPPNSETHFKVVIVASAFEGLRSVARHQRVYAELKELLAGPVHALALHTYTLDEWSERERLAPDSPECEGGSKRA